MMDNTKIDRINTLAHKAKSVGLTEEEKKEFFLQNQREVKEFEGKLFRAGKTILDRNWDGIKQRMCG